MDLIVKALEEQQINPGLLNAIREFRQRYPVEERLKERVNVPLLPFFGRETFEMAAAALLQGENILLTGTKATGKNMLAENLAYVFGRPSWNISFHVNMDSSALIGTDPFQ